MARKRSSNLTQLDIGIIDLLRKDGRITTRNLASHLGVSEVTIRKRLKRLRENAILNITAVVEPRQLGYNHDVVLNLRVNVNSICIKDSHNVQSKP